MARFDHLTMHECMVLIHAKLDVIRNATNPVTRQHPMDGQELRDNLDAIIELNEQYQREWQTVLGKKVA